MESLSDRVREKLLEMCEDAAKLNRESIPLSELVVGTECGKVTKAEKQGQRDFCIFKMNINI
jgi:altronate dehydratase